MIFTNERSQNGTVKIKYPKSNTLRLIEEIVQKVLHYIDTIRVSQAAPKLCVYMCVVSSEGMGRYKPCSQ